MRKQTKGNGCNVSFPLNFWTVFLFQYLLQIYFPPIWLEADLYLSFTEEDIHFPLSVPLVRTPNCSSNCGLPSGLSPTFYQVSLVTLRERQNQTCPSRSVLKMSLNTVKIQNGSRSTITWCFLFTSVRSKIECSPFNRINLQDVPLCPYRGWCQNFSLDVTGKYRKRKDKMPSVFPASPLYLKLLLYNWHTKQRTQQPWNIEHLPSPEEKEGLLAVPFRNFPFWKHGFGIFKHS